MGISLDEQQQKMNRTSSHVLFPHGEKAPRNCMEFSSSPVSLKPGDVTSIRQTYCSEVSQSATLKKSVSNLIYPFAPRKCLFL